MNDFCVPQLYSKEVKGKKTFLNPSMYFKILGGHILSKSSYFLIMMFNQ